MGKSWGGLVALGEVDEDVFQGGFTAKQAAQAPVAGLGKVQDGFRKIRFRVCAQKKRALLSKHIF